MDGLTDQFSITIVQLTLKKGKISFSLDHKKWLHIDPINLDILSRYGLNNCTTRSKTPIIEYKRKSMK